MNRSSQAETKDANYSNHSQRSDWTIVDAETDDALARFMIGHNDWEHAPGGGTTRDQILIAELSQPDEVALSKAEARDWTHITQKKTVRKGETSTRARPHVYKGFAGLVC
ncbi:hypothetical protein ASG35_17560 [Burkholderia sp. Leaf177]|uniref:hypothetical protein n=1 Tax=Burkholderia sp. Leaf177 TaxID=1736287 RepID=UPI0006F9111C|nr:hypothetical protein [Burkholderia sp. Leaf177]KQR74564.1 hypothetical protein ASG35_17560 [Burkholderia sp. Leaf177]